MKYLRFLWIMMLIMFLFCGCSQPLQQQNSYTSNPKSTESILDEMEGPPNNGHTLERHVGKTDEQLKQRLQQENVTAASTYYDKATAVKAVNDVLIKHDKEIQQWLKDGKQDRLVLATHHSFSVGKSVLRKDMKVYNQVFDTITVLAKNSANSRGYSILTSYPNL
ncbi:RNase A-like domain-containing lipoprotein [Ectobacillus polymachus]|uniref:RNase A-like domain-containing lipoprotein n=1 Tax=Ectobacillus polymachus TaxID=1508806 RepID=UPI003A8B5534